VTRSLLHMHFMKSSTSNVSDLIADEAQTEMRLLAFLNEEERSTFFPDHGLDKTWGLPLALTHVDPVGLDSVEAVIRRVKPDIIMGSWSTPQLPMIDNKLPAKYYCHVCGSVRRHIPRVMLENGLLVSNWGNTVAAIVAEMALMLALAAQRNLTRQFYAIHVEKTWRINEGAPRGTLYGARIGIQGLGLIGRELCKLLKPFGAKIDAFDPYQSEEVFGRCGVNRIEKLEDLYRDHDVVFVCCALTDETHGIITRKLLESMDGGAVFVNVARGKLVDQEALTDLLVSGHIRAGLDVFDVEPLAKDSPLRGLRNLVATPHIGGSTASARKQAGDLARDNIARFLRGEPVVNTVSPSQYDMMT